MVTFMLILIQKPKNQFIKKLKINLFRVKGKNKTFITKKLKIVLFAKNLRQKLKTKIFKQISNIYLKYVWYVVIVPILEQLFMCNSNSVI